MTNQPPGNSPDTDGMHVERTLLAFRRTALGLLLAATVLMRLALPTLGWLAVVGALAAAAGAGWVAVVSFRRTSSLRADDQRPPVYADGRAPSLLAAGTVLLCLVELAVLALHRPS